jgi:hypothetical protein
MAGDVPRPFQGGRVERVVLLETDVPRSWLRRSKAGLWYSVRDVPADLLRGAVTFGKLAGASAT